MFEQGTIQERYDRAVYVRNKTKRISKICAIALMLLTGLLSVIAVFASIGSSGERLNVGMFLLMILGFVLGYIMGYYYGGCTSWAYFWLEERFGMSAPVILAMFISIYVGTFVWIKHRKDPEIIKEAMNSLCI